MVVPDMNYNIEEALKPFYNVRMMLYSIPRELWDIFLPETEQGLTSLETNILALKSREADREQVMSIQRLCGMPLRPNDSLAEVKSRARVQGIKNDKLRKHHNDENQDAA